MIRYLYYRKIIETYIANISNKINILALFSFRRKSNIFIGIFDIYKKSNRTDTKNSGKGMGLALVRYIVNKLGGKIYLESKENKGTTFFVSLKQEKNEKA